MTVRLSTWLGLIGLAALAVACGDSENIDVVDLAGRLPDLVAPDHPGSVTNVVCPDEIERREGAESSCTALLSGSPVTITVTQVDGDGAVSVTLDVAPLVVEDLADDLASQLTADLDRETVVACDGPGLIVPAPDTQIGCTVTDEDGSRELTITLLDAAGGYEVRFSGS